MRDGSSREHFRQLRGERRGFRDGGWSKTALSGSSTSRSGSQGEVSELPFVAPRIAEVMAILTRRTLTREKSRSRWPDADHREQVRGGAVSRLRTRLHFDR